MIGRATAYYKGKFLFVDFVLSIIIICIFIGIIEFRVGRESLLLTLQNNRSSIYSTVAAINGSLLGFLLSSVAIVLAFVQTDNFQLLRDSPHYGTIFETYFQAITWLGVGLISSFLALLFDVDANPRVWISYFVLWNIVLVVFRIYKCIWVLYNMTILATKARINRP